MADAAEAPETVATAPTIPKICANCTHWRARHMTKHFGECHASFAGADRPLVTTDYTRCGAFQLK